MKKSLLIVSLLLSSLLLCYSQEKPKEDFQRIYFGGNMNFGFGTTTSISLSPIVGYRFTKNFSAGPGLTYQYWKFQEYTYNTYGGKVFARYTPVHFLILQTEFERLSISRGVVSPNDRARTDRVIFNGWFIGAGYVQSLGGNSTVNFMVLYNVLDNQFSPYDSNPTYRLGVNIGL